MSTEDRILFDARLELCKRYRERGNERATQRWDSPYFWRYGYRAVGLA